MKSAVTGGSGFLGTALVRRIGSNEVVVLDSHYRQDRAEKPRLGTSVLELNALRLAFREVDEVYHLAGVLGTSELQFRNEDAILQNVIGTVNVLEASKLEGVRRVFYPTKPNIWLNTYSITKKAGEEFARMYAELYNMEVRILRFQNIYGPGQRYIPVRKAVPTFIFQALHNLDIEIYGDGDQPVFLCHVADAARNIVAYTKTDGLDAVPRESGNNVRMSVNDLAGLIRRLTKSQSKISHQPMRLGENPLRPVTLGSEPTAADLLGLTDVTTPIEEGMAETVDYYAHLPTAEHEAWLDFHYRHAHERP